MCVQGILEGVIPVVVMDLRDSSLGVRFFHQRQHGIAIYKYSIKTRANIFFRNVVCFSYNNQLTFSNNELTLTF